MKMYIVSFNVNFICKTISADYNGFEERTGIGSEYHRYDTIHIENMRKRECHIDPTSLKSTYLNPDYTYFYQSLSLV